MTTKQAPHAVTRSTSRVNERSGSPPAISWMAVGLGALLVVLGILCLVAPRAAGMTSVRYLGALLALSGLVETISGLRGGAGAHRGQRIAGGLLGACVGVVIFSRPLAGMAALTFLLTAFLLAAGLFSTINSLSSRHPGWSWDFAFGVVALLLGVIAIASWPTLGAWFLGILVGIEIVARGVTLLASGLALGGAPPAAPAQSAT